MSDLEKLTELFKKFPGIGERQARRFVYYVLRRNAGFRNELADAIRSIGSHVRLCPESFQYFSPKNPDQVLSPIMLDDTRDKSKLTVVERDADLESIEKSGVYDGHYFVLGGNVSILEKEPNKVIRLSELQKQIEKRTQEGKLQEVILAFSLTPQGEHTADIVQEAIRGINPEIQVSALGRGLSTGSELEYTDKNTLESAFENRQ